jgi:hypothetical protein
VENITITQTAWTPSFGMPACAHVRAFGADVTAVQGGSLAIARVKGTRPGSTAWRPPTS